jgi:hypothetical protein
VDKQKSKKSDNEIETPAPDDASNSHRSDPAVTIAVVPDKIGEQRGNLANRAKWFGSRSGSKN